MPPTDRAEPDRPPEVPARRLRVLVGSMRIEEGSVPPPAVGEVGALMLDFVETERDETDATVSVVHARAEPAGDGTPLGGGRRRYGIPDPTPARWPTVLHGDGWTATWAAPRPVVGQVELVGRLHDDLDGGTRDETRGRFARVQVMTGLPGRELLRDVAVSPRWFDRGTVRAPVTPPRTTSGAEAGSFVFVDSAPEDPARREIGVLVDLDLDDVPPLPPRARVVPGALAAHGHDLWVLDERLPLLLRVHHTLAGPEITEYTWPGRILTAREASSRAVHPDRDGCWVTGPDGLLRARLETGDVVEVDPLVTGALVRDGVFARIVADEQGRAPRLRRWTDDGPELDDVDLGEGHVESLVHTVDGGHLALRRSRSEPGGIAFAARPAWLTAVGPDGTVVHGPTVEIAGSLHAPLLPSDPPALDDSRGRPGGLRRVRPDLTVDGAVVPERMLLRGYATAGRLWALTHPPHPEDVARRGEAAYRPLTAPPTYPEDRQYWLLTELDPVTHDPLISHLVPELPSHLAVTDDGTVWVLADGLRHLPPEDGAAARPTDPTV